jgi:hypothetical protein
MLTLNKFIVGLIAGLALNTTANASDIGHESLLIMTANVPNGISIESVRVPTAVCDAIGTQWVTESKEATTLITFLFTCAPLEPTL